MIRTTSACCWHSALVEVRSGRFASDSSVEVVLWLFYSCWSMSTWFWHNVARVWPALIPHGCPTRLKAESILKCFLCKYLLYIWRNLGKLRNLLWNILNNRSLSKPRTNIPDLFGVMILRHFWVSHWASLGSVFTLLTDGISYVIEKLRKCLSVCSLLASGLWVSALWAPFYELLRMDVVQLVLNCFLRHCSYSFWLKKWAEDRKSATLFWFAEAERGLNWSLRLIWSSLAALVVSYPQDHA